MYNISDLDRGGSRLKIYRGTDECEASDIIDPKYAGQRP